MTERRPDSAAREARLRQVAALLARGDQDKQIAATLDVNYNLIRKDVAWLREQVRAADRRDVGRIWSERQGVQIEPGTTLPLPTSRNSVESSPAQEGGQAGRTGFRPSAILAGNGVSKVGLPFRQRGSERNVLNTAQRVAWVVVLTSLVFASFGIASLGLSALSNAGRPSAYANR